MPAMAELYCTSSARNTYRYKDPRGWAEFKQPDMTGSCTNPFLQLFPVTPIERVYDTKSDIEVIAGVSQALGLLMKDPFRNASVIHIIHTQPGVRVLHSAQHHRLRAAIRFGHPHQQVQPVQQALPGADVRLDFLGRVAEHGGPVRGVDHGAAVERPVPDALAGASEGEAESLLALSQGQLHLLALGDVSDDQLDGGAVAVVEADARDLHVHHDPHVRRNAVNRDVRRHRLQTDDAGGRLFGPADDALEHLGAGLEAAVTVPRSLGYEVVAPGFPGAGSRTSISASGLKPSQVLQPGHCQKNAVLEEPHCWQR